MPSDSTGACLPGFSLASTGGLEQRLLDRFHPANQPKRIQINQTLSVSGDTTTEVLPDLSGATAWFNLPPNSPPLTPESLRGKVVLVDFWTYSCINCLRTLPYIKAWYDKYKDSGLVIIGVHTPEFPFREGRGERAQSGEGTGHRLSRRDGQRLRASGATSTTSIGRLTTLSTPTATSASIDFGEGDYDESEQWIRTLLEEANHKPLPQAATKIAASGTEAAADSNDVQSPETYVGYDRAQNFASPGGLNQDDPHLYKTPARLDLNQWAFGGRWHDEQQVATSLAEGDSISFRFHARDLHLVLGPSHGRESRSVSGSPSMARRPAPTMAWIPTPRDTAW